MQEQSSAALLRTYAAILAELRRRDVLRTNNAPLGDYVEYLAARAYGGKLEPNSNKSYDLTAPDGTRMQVKGRAIGPDTRPQAKFSPFRSFDFEVAVFVAVDLETYDVSWAREVTVEDVKNAATYSAHVNGSTVRVGTAARLGTDVTSAFVTAAEAPSPS